MKIGIDARMFGKGFGLARYVEQLILHLAEIDEENEYVFFVKDEGQMKELRASRFRPKADQPLAGNFKIVVADIPWYSLQEQLHFKKIIKQANVDLMHFPHWNVPFLYNDPFVVTIHDLIMYHYPRPAATTLGPLRFWLKDKVHRFVVKHAVGKAKHIFVTSEFTKQDVHETLGVPNKKMTVTYQAPFTSGNGQVAMNREHILNKYGITKPYAMYVGAAYPHKNLERLIEGWQKMQEEHGDEHRLVLVGKKNYFYERLQSRVAEVDSVILTGFVSDDELSVLYDNAHLYVFPSLYEGFGLPPLEAAAHNVPVVSSNRTCLPEVLGEGALYFDPESLEHMPEMIWKGLSDEDIRHELRQRAQTNLQRFSWNKLALDTKNAYIKAKNN